MFVGRSRKSLCFFNTKTETSAAATITTATTKATTKATTLKTKAMFRRTLNRGTLVSCTLLILIAHLSYHNVSAMSIDRLALERNDLQQQQQQQQEQSQQLKQQPSLTINYGNSDSDDDNDDGLNAENTNNNDNDLLVDDMQLTAVPAANGGDNTDMYMLVPADIAAEQSIQKETVETANRIDHEEDNKEESELSSGTSSTTSGSADDMLMLESVNTPAIMQIVEVPSEITIETDEVPMPQTVIDEDGDAEVETDNDNDTADEEEASEAETLPELIQEAVEQLVNSEEVTQPSSSGVLATSPDVKEETEVDNTEAEEEEENTGYQLPPQQQQQQIQQQQQQTAEAPALDYTTTPTTLITEELLVSQAAEPLVQQLQEQQIKENLAATQYPEQISQDDEIKEYAPPQEIESFPQKEEEKKGEEGEVQLENANSVDESTTTGQVDSIAEEDPKEVVDDVGVKKEATHEVPSTIAPLISAYGDSDADADEEAIKPAKEEQIENQEKLEEQVKDEQHDDQQEEKPQEHLAEGALLTETDDTKEVIQTNEQVLASADGNQVEADAEASESVVVTETPSSLLIINNYNDEEKFTEEPASSSSSLLVLSEIEQKPIENTEEIATSNDENSIKPSYDKPADDDTVTDTADVLENETKPPVPESIQNQEILDTKVEEEMGHKETINEIQNADAAADVASIDKTQMPANEQVMEQKPEGEAETEAEADAGDDDGGYGIINNNSLLTTIIQVPEQEQQEKEVTQALDSSSSSGSTTTSNPPLTNLIDNVLNYVNNSYNQQQQQQPEQIPLKTDTETTNADTIEFNGQLRRSYDGAQVWRIVVQTDKDKKLADELQTKYDGQLWKEVKQEVDYLLKPQVLAAAERHIRSANLSRIVLIDNLQQVIEVENPPAEEIAELQNRKGHRLSWQAYHRLEDIHGFIDYMAKTYPDICSVETIGYSVEKRPLKILKISNGNASNPSIWIDGGMHAREWISPATVTFIANQLIEGWEDLPEHMRQMNYYLHPVANPDGYEYSHTTDRLWRKNMRSHGRQCPGVDLNRNFGYKWGGKGTSASPCAQTYRGSKAFSEPETFYISKFISGHPRNTFQGYLSFHSYGQFILYPWGYDYHLTQDRGDLDRVARQAGTSITKLIGDKYTVGSSATTLYPAAGGSDDWAKGIAGIKYAYTIEMGDTGRYGFVLPARFIHPNGKVGYTFVETVARAIINERTKTSRKRIF